MNKYNVIRTEEIHSVTFADCTWGSGGSVLVWAGIAHGLRTNLVVIEENMSMFLRGMFQK
jgi:hypothetical protein